jgi:Flp pilus assembly protein CpaB
MPLGRDVVRRSNRLIILIGVFLAIVSVLGVIALGGGGGGGGGGGNKGTPTPTPEPKVAVVLAKADINLGDKITGDMVETKDMTLSARDALPGTSFDNVNLVIGRVAGGSIKKGEILYADTSFMQPGTFVTGKDLASAITTGHVAVSMEVDQVNGVGTLLVPGDRVDIVLSLWVEEVKLTAVSDNGKWKYDLGNPEHATSKMVIQNRKVLATLLPVPETPTNANANAASPSVKPKATAQTVTNSGTHMIVIIEVLPEEAELIRWAQREETKSPQNYIELGLALRSDKDNDAPDTKTLGITFKELVTRYGVLPPDPRAILPADLARQISW